MSLHHAKHAAVHEAGHAVVRLVRTGIATALDVSADGSGYSHGSGDRIRTSDAIEIAMAGYLAEARARKCAAARIVISGHAQDDWRRVESLSVALAAALGTTFDAVVREAEICARRILRENWDAVERLSSEAIARGSLTGSEVAAIAAL